MRFRAVESSPKAGATQPERQRQLAVSDRDMTSEASVRQFWRRCRLVLESKPTVLVIDLTHVIRADTKLIACLAGLYQLGRDEHVQLEVLPSAAVNTVARICHLEPLLESMSSGSVPVPVLETVSESPPTPAADQPIAGLEKLISQNL